jgi:hypothetical protein
MNIPIEIFQSPHIFPTLSEREIVDDYLRQCKNTNCEPAQEKKTWKTRLTNALDELKKLKKETTNINIHRDDDALEKGGLWVTINRKGNIGNELLLTLRDVILILLQVNKYQSYFIQQLIQHLTTQIESDLKFMHEKNSFSRFFDKLFYRLCSESVFERVQYSDLLEEISENLGTKFSNPQDDILNFIISRYQSQKKSQTLQKK